MDFRGHLRLPEDAGTGIPVRLRLDDIFVVISSGGDELGAWRADDVVLERIFSNQFSIVLDGESMVFIAQDALGFAYEGVTAIEDLQERLGKKRKFRRSKKTKPADVSQSSDASPELEQADRDDDSVPTEEPALSGEAVPIWSPPQPGTPVANPAASAVLRPPPEYEPATNPVQPPEPAPVRSEEVRVAYPRTPRPAPPAVPTFVPPVTDEPSTPGPADAPAKPEFIPAAEAAPAVAEPEPTIDVAATVGIEFEIEEVAPAASGAIWRDETSLDVSEPVTEPEPEPEPEMEREQPEPEPEIEMDEYMLPAAGTVETFDHRHPEPLAAAPEPEIAIDEPLIEAASQVEENVAEIAEIEAVEVEEVPPSEEVVYSNGHVPTGKLDDSISKRERRHSLFGRSRDKKVPPHDHSYGEPKTIGGLTRKVCDVCGHVTFSGEDVYQGW